MKTGTKKQTKFIASLSEEKDSKTIEVLAKVLNKDGIKIDHVSTMLGYLSGNANISLKELQKRYKPKGLNIELNKQVKTQSK